MQAGSPEGIELKRFGRAEKASPIRQNMTMQDFFNGWRRKAGMATLGLACILTCGWLRSFYASDWILFPTGDGTGGSGHLLLSAEGSFFCGLNVYPYSNIRWKSIHWQSDQADEYLPTLEAMEPTWYLHSCGFNVGRAELLFPPDFHVEVDVFCLMPYWSIVLPLTLLSAWLLLSKPQKA